MGTSPQQHGLSQSRWTLRTLQAHCRALRHRSVSGVWRFIQRVGARYKRGQAWVHSPDPDYTRKVERVQQCLRRAPVENAVVVFVDEWTYYRQPKLGQAWARVGRRGARVPYVCAENKGRRVVAALEAHTGRVVFWEGKRVDVAAFVHFLRQVCTVFSGVAQVYAVLDNWSVHFHPDVVEALVPQQFAADFRIPPHWSGVASGRFAGWALPVQLVPLPTYAPWTNPIEQLWRWLSEQVVVHHPWAAAVEHLQAAVCAFLDDLRDGSSEVLRRARLGAGVGLYGEAFTGGG